MDTEKCRALIVALDIGSLSAAAKQLGYTVGGVSRMMAILEEETGFPLLVRSKSGVSPTSECEALLPVMRDLVYTSEKYGQTAAALRGLDSGRVTVCCESIDHGPGRIAGRLGVVFQNSMLDAPLSVMDNLRSRAALYGIRGRAFAERRRRFSGRKSESRAGR